MIHGHVDHTETYLSQVDYIYWQENPTKLDRPETWKDYKIDVYLKNGNTVVLGDKKIYVYSTPGHTPVVER